MKTVYVKMKKHNREENVMKGFIEVMNQIKDICKEHETCKGCPFIDDSHVRRVGCYLVQDMPEDYDPLEILRRLQAHD
mgnify:CR=1 FL=1